jgi:hypothetical protein
MGEKKSLGMLHAAKMMRRYGGRPATARRPETPSEPQEDINPRPYRSLRDAAEEAPRPNDVRAVPESWINGPRAPVKKQQQRRPRSLNDQLIDAQMAQLEAQRKHKSAITERLSEPYVRTCKSVSLSMTRAEEQALRKHARSLDMSFSKWARIILFTAAGVPIPEDRPRKKRS